MTLRWRLLSWADRLDRLCKAWAGTKYVQGQGVKGKATDCLNFVAGVLEEASGRKVEMPRPLRYTSPKEFFSTVRRLMRLHRVVRVKDGTLETGDILLMKRDQGPHIALVTRSPHFIWHAEHPSVHISSLQTQRRILSVLRPLGKESWPIAQ